MHRLTRRQLLQGSLALAGLGLLSGCGQLPFQAQAKQPPKTPRLGVLDIAPGEGGAPAFDALLEGLGEHGYVDGRNIAIEHRVAGRDDQFPELAAELVNLPVDIILAGSFPATRAARQATSTIPIVMASIADPVGQGLVSSLARPGGNVTGMSLQSVEITAKRLELLKEAIPAAARVAVLQNPNNPVGARSLQELEPAARTLGLQVQVLDIRPPEDLEPALDAAVREHADMLLVTSDPLFGQRYSQIADLAAKRHVPALHPRREFVEAGGLMSYGPSVPDLWRRSAAYVDKILNGASPADLPVEQPMTFDFAINLKTARALGLTIPQEVLMQATEVIQ